MSPPPRKAASVDPGAPHGRNEDGSPKAPYGYKNGTNIPRIKPAGPGARGKDDKARIAKELPAGDGKAAEKRDYSAQIGDLADGFWMLMSAAPVPIPKIRTRLHAQAAIVKANRPGLVTGLNAAAQNNDSFARGIEKLTTGNVSWVLPAMFALTPFVAQSAFMWRAPEAGDVEALAKHNETQWDEFVQAAAAAAAEDGEAGV